MPGDDRGQGAGDRGGVACHIMLLSLLSRSSLSLSRRLDLSRLLLLERDLDLPVEPIVGLLDF